MGLPILSAGFSLKHTRPNISLQQGCHGGLDAMVRKTKHSIHYLKTAGAQVGGTDGDW